MSGTFWLLSSQKSGILFYDLDQPYLEGEDYDLEILCPIG
jgi:hypothetical protein